MNHALFVRVLHRVGDLAGVVEHGRHVHRAAGRDDVLERFPRDVLHDNEEHVVLLFGGDDRDDVGVIQRRQEARFTQQFAEVKILAVRNLERHPLVDPRVFGEVHGPESAAAQRLENAIFAKCLAAKHHSRESI